MTTTLISWHAFFEALQRQQSENFNQWLGRRAIADGGGKVIAYSINEEAETARVVVEDCEPGRAGWLN